MQQPTIIVIINKKPYTLCASNVETIRGIPSADRQQLITLLEAINREESRAQQVAAKVIASTATTSVNASNAPGYQDMRSERIGSGDADAMMAQLIMEENLNQKPGLTKQSIQKWTAVVAVVVFLLVLIM